MDGRWQINPWLQRELEAFTSLRWIAALLGRLPE
jgi:hypothetical protein